MNRHISRREFLVAGTVLPQVLQASELPRFPSSCRLAGRVCRYDGSHLRTSRKFAIAPSGMPAEVEIEGSHWTCRWDFHRVLNRADTVELVLDFEVAEGPSPRSSVGLMVIWDNWSTGDYVLLPGAGYNGNRFESRLIKYPPLLSDPKDMGVNAPTIITVRTHLKTYKSERKPV